MPEQRLSSVRQIQVVRHQDGHATQELRSESVAIESPLEIRVNGESFSVTMSTPGHDVELAHGLLFAENVIINSAWFPATTESRDCALTSRIVDLCIPEGSYQWPSSERRLMATSSCGLCGQASLDGLDAHLDHPLQPAPFAADQVGPWFATMRTHQAAFDSAGGTHAAAVFDHAGNCLAVHEDIGRHNAVDKIIGNLIQRDCLTDASVLTVSGRVSFEIMVKALRAGIPTLAAVSAPSSLAVDLARRNGMTLLGFCRDRRFTVYSGADHIALQEGYDVRIVA